MKIDRRSFRRIGLLAFLLVAPRAKAEEGMWTFDDVPRDRVRSEFGVSIDDGWLERLRRGAVKVGASGSFVSGDGLIMTNHHVASGCIQELSTAADDLVANGFRAAAPADERRCPAMEARHLVAIEDVTEKVLAATKGKTDKAFVDAQKAEMARLEKRCVDARGSGKRGRGAAGDERTRCEVVTLFHGGAYHLYEYRVWTDVRLVFAPEFDIAFFGGDPDNYEFPRWNLDVAFLRAWEDGKPASTPHHLPWSTDGVKEGDPVFVAGHPGATQRLLTGAQQDFLRDVEYPAILLRLSEWRGAMDEFGRRDAESARIAKRDLYSALNYLKRYRGYLDTLNDDAFAGRQAEAEAALRGKVAADPAARAAYGGAWEAIEAAQAAKRRLFARYSTVEGHAGLGISGALFAHARTLVRGAAERAKPDAGRLREFRGTAIPSLEAKLFSTAPVHAALEERKIAFSLTKMREALGPDDPTVRAALGSDSPDAVARAVVAGTRLADPAERRRLWNGGAPAIAASDDPMVLLAKRLDADARDVRRRWEDEVEGPERKNGEKVARAGFALSPVKRYPDATGTLRLSVGRVRGLTEPDGTVVAPFTTIGGTFGRATGSEPFALPKRWLDRKRAIDPDVPFNFVTDNDTIGGNSGSPVVDSRGRVVGLVFDGNIHSLGGAFWFDPARKRAVAVDARAILHALQVIYDADGLADELVSGRRAEN